MPHFHPGPLSSSGGPDRPLAPPAQVPGATPGAAPRVRSTQLFHGAQEVEIVHGRDVYRLRITSLGRLILTK